MPRDSRSRLDDIIEAAERIESYIAGFSLAQFQSDRKTIDAVLRNLEIIGEAVKTLPHDIRALHPQMPWTRMAGLRDLLIHEYFGVDDEIIWQIATEKVTELKFVCREILQKLESDEANPQSDSSASAG